MLLDSHPVHTSEPSEAVTYTQIKFKMADEAGNIATVGNISHSEFNTGQEMPTNTELRDTYSQKIIPEQTNYQVMNEVSFLIDNRDKTWVDLNELKLEVQVKHKLGPLQNFPNTEYRPGFLENNIFHSLFEKNGV